MLTPQDIQTKEFAKAVFGGYDMAAVDDFLEELTDNYTSLYKENAILKGKIKVLVEKVEEYRSTEDAMRMALLTAQKMSDDMVDETKKKCDDMLSEADKSAESIRNKLEKEFSQEQMKLEAAKVKTAAFVQASQQIIEKYSEFLDKLDDVTQEYGGAASQQPEMEKPVAHCDAEPKRSPEPEPAAKAAPVPDGEVEMDDTIKEIDDFVADVMEEEEKPADMSAETRRIDTAAINARDVDDSPTKRISWNEEDELTTPRPKFDFSDLKFGAKYSDDKKQ